MAWNAPDVGEIELLKRVLYANPATENLTLKLYKNSVVYAETDTASTYTVADFTGYSDKTLTSTQSGSTWGAPTTSSGVTSSTYGTSFVWTAGSGQSIFGQYIVGATSGILLLVDPFAGAKTLASGDTMTTATKISLD